MKKLFCLCLIIGSLSLTACCGSGGCDTGCCGSSMDYSYTTGCCSGGW